MNASVSSERGAGEAAGVNAEAGGPAAAGEAAGVNAGAGEAAGAGFVFGSADDLTRYPLEPDANGMVSIGVTLDVPDPYGSILRQARADFGDPRAEVVPAHITIIPPMEIPADSWPLVAGHIRQVADHTSPFVISLRGTGTFMPVSPVVFIALARGISDCETLSRQLRTGVLNQPLTFNYHPHVTVAQELAEDVLEDAFVSLEEFTVSFMAHGFGVYVHRGNDEWKLLARVPFGP